jgi:hypothetical protein
VSPGAESVGYSGTLTLREMRRFIRSSNARMAVVFFGLLYTVGSLLGGGMLILAHIPGGYSTEILLGGGPGTGPWNYPGLLVIAPWGVLSLPFFATLAMVVVAVGVGLGMTVAFLLAVRLVRRRSEFGRASGALGAFGGLTPAMISLVTLGACCSTTAAATAGVGLVAASSGTTVTNLLVNNWFLGVFQIAIVWVALLGQELLLRVYRGVLGTDGSPAANFPRETLSSRAVLWAVLRGALLVGGLLWILSVGAEWTTLSPASAGAGYWFQWIGEHGLVGGVAVVVAFFPREFARWLLTAPPALRASFRLVLGAIAVVLLAWLPPPLPAWGLDSLTNQVIAAATGGGASVMAGAWGSVAFVARLGIEYALLAGYSLALALAPTRALGPAARDAFRSVPGAGDRRPEWGGELNPASGTLSR